MSARAGLKQQIKQRVGQHRIDRVRSYQRRIQGWYVRKLDAARLALDPDEEIFVCYKPLRHRMT
jgi:hypothetical protein